MENNTIVTNHGNGQTTGGNNTISNLINPNKKSRFLKNRRG